MDLDIKFSSNFYKKIDAEAYVKACRKGLIKTTTKFQRSVILKTPFRTGGTRRSWLLKKIDKNSYLVYNHHRSGDWNIANLLNIKKYVRRNPQARTMRAGTTKFGNPRYIKPVSAVKRSKGFIDKSLDGINLKKDIDNELAKYIKRLKN